MPNGSGFSPSPLLLWGIRLVGLIIFVVAFFLPAVGLAPNDPNPLLGWKCAAIALTMPFSKEQTFNLDLILVMLSGFLNFFFLLYLILSPVRNLKLIRWGFIALILISMISTWMFFGRQHYVPQLGHYLWIAGAVIVMLPEFFGRKRMVQ